MMKPTRRKPGIFTDFIHVFVIAHLL
jgi:hypothetical protein